MKTLQVIMILFAVALIGVLLYIAKHQSLDEQPPVPGSGPDASQGDILMPSSSHQVVFIGLDGATWKIIDPMIQSGALPTFKRLKEEGASGVLKSVDCYITPPAWTSMLTGFSPDKTGIYTFGKWVAEDRKFKAYSSLDVQVPYVWDIASNAGRRVGVTNVPLTYPARPVNGVMATGLMTPIVYKQRNNKQILGFNRSNITFDKTLDRKTINPVVAARHDFAGNAFVMALYDTKKNREWRYDTVALKVFPSDGDWKPTDDVPIRVFKLNEYSPWFPIDYRPSRAPEGAADRVACSIKINFDGKIGNRAELHILPLLRMPTDPDLRLTHPESFAEDIEKEFGHYLITLAYSEDMIAQGTEQTADFASYFYNYDDWDLFCYAFMAPDNAQHRKGDGELTRSVYESIDRFLARLIDKLPEDATLILASDHGFSKYDYIVSPNTLFEDLGLLANPRDIDHDKTLVFHNQWCLYFNDDLLNVDELERRGIHVAPGELPRKALINYLQEKGREITFEGRPMPIEFVEIPEDGAGTAPDMVVWGGYGDYCVVGADLRIPARTTVRKTTARESWFHARDGMFLLWGNQIKRGVGSGAKKIEDIAPTILYLLDLPLARNFDGAVMEDLMRPEILAAKEKHYLDNYMDLVPEKDYTFEELESLEDKLKTLGYIQ